MSEIADKLRAANGFGCKEGASESQIAEAESVLGLTFAKEFKDYALECGAAYTDDHELTGICSSKLFNVIDVTIEARKMNPTIPDDFYVVEDAHIDGILIWQNTTGAVYMSWLGGQIKKVADSLQEYLKI